MIISGNSIFPGDTSSSESEFSLLLAVSFGSNSVVESSFCADDVLTRSSLSHFSSRSFFSSVAPGKKRLGNVNSLNSLIL